jgi:ABC-2 type transport system permease protein
MNDIFILLTPELSRAKNQIQNRSGSQNQWKLITLVMLAGCFWAGLFWISHKVLLYFSSIENIGLILSYKLLSMIIAVGFSLFFISSIITSISRFYLSKDLICVHALPVPTWRIFFSRWLISFFDSSWMVLLYIIPVLLSYLIVFDIGVLSLILMGISVISMAVTASVLGAMVVVILVMLIPAGRLKSIFIVFGILIFCLLYIFGRMIKPEQLVNPEAFNTVLLYISSLKTPSSPFFPGTWVFESIRNLLENNIFSAIMDTALSWSFAMISMLLLLLTADFLYKKGLSRSLGKSEHTIKCPSNDQLLKKRKPSFIMALAVKEMKYFFRDQTQWSQIFLVLALIIIYVYNFTLLPLDKSPIGEFYLQNILSFLNMGLAFFVLIAIAGRFAYPAISMESEAFWIIQSSPISLSQVLWVKFFVYLAPLFILTQILIVITNMLLHVTSFMMVISIVTTAMMVPPVVGFAIGIGSIFADFNLENPMKSVTGFGGMVYMISSAILVGSIIILEAGPVYMIFMAGIKHRSLAMNEILWCVICFGLVPIICILSVFISMKLGVKYLKKREST